MDDHHDGTQSDVSEADAELLASGQKLLIAAIVINYAGAKVVADVPVLLVLVGAIALSVFFYAVWKISKGFRWSPLTFGVNLFFLLIPLVNLIALLRINRMVTRALRGAGYAVGLFGASR